MPASPDRSRPVREGPCRRYRWGGAVALSLAALLADSTLSAQSDNMGQGEASIAVRSDVRLAVKGTGGTTSERLAKLGQAVSDQLSDIRGCYRKQVATTPELVGRLRLRLSLEAEKRPVMLEMLEQVGTSDALSKCVQQMLKRARYAEVGRPAAAFVSLDFDNSRARGQADMEEGSAKLARVDVATSPEGTLSASWATDGGEVRFAVETKKTSSPQAVELLLQGFKQGYAPFLDCRRKCEQGGKSPEGDIFAQVTVDRTGRLRTVLGAISVPHARAPGCAQRALQRIQLEKPTEPIEALVTIHFAR